MKISFKWYGYLGVGFLCPYDILKSIGEFGLAIIWLCGVVMLMSAMTIEQ